ncbi:MAG: DoxX family protein [Ignavibacteria bacterium]|nr:DoxX family protein [Ignavibacteria bacterium]MBI3766632.1 DoxX family protein [Ignavibacteriales bacterium]
MIGQYIGFHPSLSALLLRLALGYIFIPHGYQKLFKEPGPKGVAGFFKNIGVPAPLFFAYVVGSVEFFGGILLILGLLTRVAALLIVINMFIAIVKVKYKTGLISKVMEGGWVGGYELDLALVTMALVLVVFGSGKFSIDFVVLKQW